MTDRLEIFLHELTVHSLELKCDEFEFYWEMWGAWWTPWFLEIDKKSLSFSFNDISYSDLDELEKNGFIELIKVYDQTEMTDEFDRKRYRIVKAHAPDSERSKGSNLC
ncbi:MAG: hypothetical protein K0S32_4242 [Bacteroidetes bacterium]|jgi:hypothetical protein|nr:hypothetical protein [Bacteroidota bacterium]